MGWSNGIIYLWDGVTGERKQTLDRHKSFVYSVAFSPDGRTLASGGGWPDGTVHLWDAGTGEHKGALTEHRGAVYGIAFSPDGTTLASGVQTELSACGML